MPAFKISPYRTVVDWAQGTVTTSAVALASTAESDEVVIQARHNNAGTIMVGFDVTVTEIKAGIALIAGESVSIPIDDPSRIFIIATVAGQVYNYMVFRT